MTRVLKESLNSLDYDVHIVQRRFSTSVGEVGQFSLRKIISGIWMSVRLTVSLIRNRPRFCIFFMTNRPGSFLVDNLLATVLRVLRVQTIGYVHTQGFLSIADRGAVWAFLARRLLRTARSIVCLSPRLETDVSSLVENTRVTSIANTVPEEREFESTNKPETAQVLYLSNLIPEKGIDDFLEMAAVLTSRRLEASFVAAGAPLDEDQLSHLRHVAGQTVSVIGQVGPDAKKDLFRNSIVLAFPSRYPYEAQPLVILEAMSFGLPVVAYSVGGIADIIDDGRNGYLVDVGDKDAFLRAVSRLVEDVALTRRMGLQARRDYEQKYSRTKFTEAWAHELAQQTA